jgi:hypothetical protein
MVSSWIDFRTGSSSRWRRTSGWISLFQYNSDHLWEKHRFWTKSELTKPPTSYFKRQVYATFMEDPVGLRERHHIGVDNIMWASDNPHSETDMATLEVAD